MDLAAVLADKALLANLSREYELLKATHAGVDYEQWITARLQRAAAARTSSNSRDKQHAATAGPGMQQQQRTPVRRASVSLRTPSGKAPPARLTTSSANNSRRSSAADNHQQQPAPQQAAWQAQDVTNHVTNHQGREQEAQQPSLIKINTTSSRAQPQGQGQTAAPPHWVAAAQLGSALQASKVVPVMHAAAERERRLAAAAALARQRLDLGVVQAPPAVLSGAADEQQLQPAAQEQLQQVVRLTQEVVQQNQMLQQAMHQQQAQLSQHEGLLTTVLQTQQAAASNRASQAQQASAAQDQAPLPAAQLAAKCTVPATHAGLDPQQAAAAVTAPGTCPPSGQLPDLIKDSWLVKAVLQQQLGTTSKGQKQAGGAAAGSSPDFIRIAGAAKKPPKPSTQQRQQAVQDSQQQVSPDAVVSDGASAAADRRRQLKAVLRQVLTRGVGSLPDGLAGLVAGLQGLHESVNQQQEPHLQEQSKGAQQDAAASLVVLLQQQQQRAQLSKAQQLVLQRRKLQEERERQRLAEGGEADDGGRPGWQSDVYVPPPSRMLRVKKAGAADVWNAAPSSKPGAGAPNTPGSKAANKSNKQQLAPRKGAQPPAGGGRGRLQQQQRGNSDGSKRNLSSVLHGAGWRVDGGIRQQQVQPPNPMHSRAGGPVRVEHTRLARFEEGTTQALEAGARLEQRLQQEQLHTQPARGHDPVLQLEPSALDSLLAALDRVDQQEKEICEKWFGGGSSGDGDKSSSSDPAAGGAGSEQRPLPDSGGSQAAITAAPAGGLTGPAAADPSRLQPSSPHTARHNSPAAPSQHMLEQQQEHMQQVPCMLSEAAIKSIQAGRQRLLRHQAVVDGSFQELGAGGAAGISARCRDGGSGHHRRTRTLLSVLQPTQVVEAVADLLLDELLMAEAADLDGFCDALCTQLFEDEFEEA